MPSKTCAEPGCRAIVPMGTDRCPRHAKQHREAVWRAADKRRAMREDARRLYKTARWQKVRLIVFTRDGWRCQWRGCGVIVMTNVGRGDPRLAICDHKKPHRGEEERFFDVENLQTLCKQCHDRFKQREERRLKAAGGGSISGPRSTGDPRG